MDKNSADENWISYEKEDTASQNGNTEIADNTEKNRHPLWRTWWFWTAVGVLLLTAILLAVFLPKNKKQDARITQPAEISSQQQAVQNTETPQQIRQPTIPQENQPQSSGSLPAFQDNIKQLLKERQAEGENLERGAGEPRLTTEQEQHRRLTSLFSTILWKAGKIQIGNTLQKSPAALWTPKSK